jgi:hypothetical protein
MDVVDNHRNHDERDQERAKEKENRANSHHLAPRHRVTFVGLRLVGQIAPQEVQLPFPERGRGTPERWCDRRLTARLQKSYNHRDLSHRLPNGQKQKDRGNRV